MKKRLEELYVNIRHPISIQMSRALDFGGCKQAEALCFHFFNFYAYVGAQKWYKLKSLKNYQLRTINTNHSNQSAIPIFANNIC